MTDVDGTIALIAILLFISECVAMLFVRRP